MKDLDHAILILIALVVTIAGYCLLVIVAGDNPKFLEGAVLGLATGLLGYAGRSK